MRYEVFVEYIWSYELGIKVDGGHMECKEVHEHWKRLVPIPEMLHVRMNFDARDIMNERG